MSSCFTVPIVTTFPAMPIMFLVEAYMYNVYSVDVGAKYAFPRETMAHTIALFVLLMYATRVSARSVAIPLLVQQINFGKEIDFQRWCVCWSIENDRASMRIFGGTVEVNQALMGKAVWATGAGVAVIASKLYDAS